jgi:spermidine/putrescine-binding protein
MGENRPMRAISLAAVALAASAALGCGADGSGPEEIGDPEGGLVLVDWAGHLEDGSDDSEADWVTSFETGTGCEISWKEAATKSELVEMLESGVYDGAAAPDSVVAALAGDDVIAPINVDLLPNELTLFEDLRPPDELVVGEAQYAIPHGRGYLHVERAKREAGKAKGAKKRPAPLEIPVARPDGWVIAGGAAHPNCMYLWLNHTIDPAVSAKTAEYLLEAPAQERACPQTSDPDFCDRVHADDPEYWETVAEASPG